jgi:hypothetical protein
MDRAASIFGPDLDAGQPHDDAERAGPRTANQPIVGILPEDLIPAENPPAGRRPNRELARGAVGAADQLDPHGPSRIDSVGATLLLLLVPKCTRGRDGGRSTPISATRSHAEPNFSALIRDRS